MSSSEEDNAEEMTPADVDDEDEVVVNAQSEDEDDDSEDDAENHNGDEAASPVPSAKRQKISPLEDAKQTPVDDEDEEDVDEDPEEDDEDEDDLVEGNKKVMEDAKEGEEEEEELVTPTKKRGRRGRGSVSSPHKDKELLSAAKGLTIPFRAVKRIMKVDKDIATVQNEAAMVASYAVELFIQNLAKDSYEHAKHRGRNTIRYEDVAEERASQSKYSFLETLLP